MTPDKNFRLKASTKTVMALGKFKDAQARNEYKRAMIDAQLHEESAKRAALKSKDMGSDNKSRSRGEIGRAHV